MSIFLLILSGFFFYMVDLMAFFSIKGVSEWGKMVGMAIFGVPALAFLLLGTWRRAEGTRMWAAGITLLSTAGFMIFAAYTLWAMVTSPELAKFMKPETKEAISDYRAGGCGIALYALVGGGLLWFSRRKKQEF